MDLLPIFSPTMPGQELGAQGPEASFMVTGTARDRAGAKAQGLTVCDITHWGRKSRRAGPPTKSAGPLPSDCSPAAGASQLSPVMTRSLLCRGPRHGGRELPRWPRHPGVTLCVSGSKSYPETGRGLWASLGGCGFGFLKLNLNSMYGTGRVALAVRAGARQP